MERTIPQAHDDLRRNLHLGQVDRYNRMAAAVLAQELGLDEDKFAGPFPGNQSVTINKFPELPEVKRAARKGLHPLAGIALGALLAGLPILGYLLANKDPIIKTVEKIIEKPVEKIIKQPGTNYDVDVDMEVIPPKGAE